MYLDNIGKKRLLNRFLTLKRLRMVLRITDSIIDIAFVTVVFSTLYAFITNPFWDLPQIYLMFLNIWFFKISETYPILGITVSVILLLSIVFSAFFNSFLKINGYPYILQYANFALTDGKYNQNKKSKRRKRNTISIIQTSDTSNQMTHDTLEKLETIKKWIASDSKFEEEIKSLLIRDSHSTPTEMHLDSTSKIYDIYYRLDNLEQQLRKPNLKEWLSITNNVVGIIVAIPAIFALIISILMLIHH